MQLEQDLPSYSPFPYRPPPTESSSWMTSSPRLSQPRSGFPVLLLLSGPSAPPQAALVLVATVLIRRESSMPGGNGSG